LRLAQEIEKSKSVDGLFAFKKTTITFAAPFQKKTSEKLK